ncbi:MAG: acyltransferase family protein [Opitutales bacterium]
MQRNYTIDILRLVAAYGVVLAHLQPFKEGGEVPRFLGVLVVVPFFLVVSLYFLQARGASFARMKPWRLIVPYICWSALYLGMRFAKAQMSGEELRVDWTAVIFNGAASVQLYFIPALVCFQAVACALDTFFTSAKTKSWLWAVSTAILLGLAYVSEYRGYNGYVIGPQQGMFTLAIWYVLSAQIVVLAFRDTPGGRAAKLLSVTLAACALSAIYVPPASAMSYALLPPVVAALILGAGVAWPIRTLPPWLIRILGTAYGIFLIHPLFIEASELVAGQVGFALTPYSEASRLLVGVGIFVASLVAVLVIQRIPGLCYLLLGERRQKALAPAPMKA